jgi:hypothetical protein
MPQNMWYNAYILKVTHHKRKEGENAMRRKVFAKCFICRKKIDITSLIRRYGKYITYPFYCEKCCNPER